MHLSIHLDNHLGEKTYSVSGKTTRSREDYGVVHLTGDRQSISIFAGTPQPLEEIAAMLLHEAAEMRRQSEATGGR